PLGSAHLTICDGLTGPWSAPMGIIPTLLGGFTSRLLKVNDETCHISPEWSLPALAPLATVSSSVTASIVLPVSVASRSKRTNPSFSERRFGSLVSMLICPRPAACSQAAASSTTSFTHAATLAFMVTCAPIPLLELPVPDELLAVTPSSPFPLDA